MSRPQIFVALFGFLSIAASEQTALEHRFVAKRIECSSELSELPQSSKAWNQTEHRWMDSGTLELVFWDAETADLIIDDSSSRVLLRGDQIDLQYTFQEIEFDAEAPMHSCSVPVKISFVIDGLVRGPYTLRAERRSGPPILIRTGD